MFTIENHPPVKPPIPTAQHSHSSLLHLALKAKEEGNGWADMALHQISLLTGITYDFERIVNSGSNTHKIVKV